MTNLGLIAMTLGGVIGTGSVQVLAAEQGQDTPVQYTNTKGIPDPDDPTNPDYVINVPAAISFTDEEKEIDASVTMTAPNGTKYAGDKSANISVTSKNNYKLTYKDDAIGYKLAYNGKLMSDTEQVVGTTNKTEFEVEGKADLVGKAKHKGLYTDTLTYKVDPVV